jgi:hypothetical protein
METLENRLVELVFSDWKTVKSFLVKQGIKITETEDTQVCENPNFPNFRVGFDWETLDYFTRGHQLQFIFFRGLHFFELVRLIEKKYKELKLTKNKGKTNV